MLALRHSAAMLGVLRQDVAFEDDHLVEVRGDRSGGAEAGDASAEDDCSLAE